MHCRNMQGVAVWSFIYAGQTRKIDGFKSRHSPKVKPQVAPNDRGICGFLVYPWRTLVS